MKPIEKLKIILGKNPWLKKIFLAYEKHSLLVNIMLLALFARIAFFHFIETFRLFEEPIQDSYLNIKLAEKISHGEGMGFFWSKGPAYLSFIGLLYKFFGNIFLYWNAAAHAAVGFVCVLLVFSLAKKVFGNSSAVVSALFFSIFGPFLASNFQVIPQTITVFLVLAILNLIVWRFPSRDSFRLLLIGLLMFLLVMVDFLFLPTVLAGSVLLAYFSNGNIRKKTDNALFVVSGMTLAFLLINFTLALRLAPASQDEPPGWAVNIFEQNRIESWQFYGPEKSISEKISAYDLLANKERQVLNNNSSAVAFLFGELAVQLRENPFAFVKALAIKAALVFNGFSESQNFSLGQYSRVIPYFRFLPGFALFAALGLLGMLLVLFDKKTADGGRKEQITLVVALALLLLPPMIVFPFAEYKITAYSILIVFAGFFVANFSRYAAKFARNPQVLIYSFIAIITAFLLSGANIATTPYGSDALFANLTAKHKIETQQYVDAESLLLSAERAQPDYFPTYENLHKLYMLNGDYISAKKYLAKKIMLNPNSEWNYLALERFHEFESQNPQIVREFYLGQSDGNLADQTEFIPQADYFRAIELLENKNLDAAEIEFEKLARTDFQHKEFVFFRIGVVNMLKNNPKKAENFFRQSVDLNPFLLPARYNLAQIAIGEEKCKDAIDQLSEIYRDIPDYGETVYLLADCHLKLDQQKEALPFMKEFVEKNKNNRLVEKEVGIFEGKILILEREIEKERDKTETNDE